MSEETMPAPWQVYYDLLEEAAMPMWAIYRPPVAGFDAKLWVARLWATLPEPIPANTVYTAGTLDALRDKLPPGMAYLAGGVTDDPNVVEVWL